MEMALLCIRERQSCAVNGSSRPIIIHRESLDLEFPQKDLAEREGKTCLPTRSDVGTFRWVQLVSRPIRSRK
jgi:hypothetical protein